MVTDPNTNYTSPAGKDFTFAAARFAGINPSSRVLDMGCGYGEGACNLASEFRCKITACDISKENLDLAREAAEKRNVSHLISFEQADIIKSDYSRNPYDLIIAEGGVLSFISRRKGLSKAGSWLVPRGWLAFSDLIMLSDNAPDEIRAIFEDETYHYETESSYRNLISELGMEIHFMCLVPVSGWDNYYAHMARRLEDNKGFFSDRRIKLAFHREIDVFYRLKGFRYVGYLFCVVRRKT
ncbi:MAG TPA: methyltransferase domain-containing protein [Chitinispirillaceae bacterium]|nr:methyltransferase domain-containing protein [Chitinispirillaceae bacterium]